ncbi:MAG: PilC/PilY family type IV pilus protein [Desulfosudaceae bacterium]
MVLFNRGAGILIGLVLICGTMFPAVADDNDIFAGRAATVEPNILIIFDTSLSMNQDAEAGRTRMEVAQDTVKNIIDDYGPGNRFGIMVFHKNNNRYSNGGYFPEYEGLYPVCSVKESFIRDNQGNLKNGQDYQAALTEYRNYLKDFVDSLQADGYTPLAETLAEAGLYFAEQDSWFNTDTSDYPRGGTYPDDKVKAYCPDTVHPPVGYRCRKNYIILMTDGYPTNDNNNRLKGKYINSETIADGNLPRLDQVAGFLYEHDINANFDSADYKQNIITYAIGFQGGDPKLLQDTADRGCGAGNALGVDDGGLYFDATDPEDLSEAFTAIMADINRRQAMFAAPVVPVDNHSKAYAGQSVYLSMFQPSPTERWIGNLKKYRLNDSDEIASCQSQTPILDSSGKIRDSARSCWSEASDGSEIGAGGAGAVLLTQGDEERLVLANIDDDNNNLRYAGNAFQTTNQALEPDVFGVSGSAARDELINRVRGRDLDWKLGDFNHSRPAVVTYENSAEDSDSYIFAGANDGLLHCFDDDDGSEVWAFVPREQFSRLRYVNTGGHHYFMDGSPTVAEINPEKIILICGERRGGNHYYALDITDIEEPLYLYTHITDGQSWKQPQFATMACAGAECGDKETRPVFLVTGGYDEGMDHDSPEGLGRSVYTIDAVTGEPAGFYMGAADFPDMSCLVNAVALDLLDDGREVVSHVYAADLAGHVYAARDCKETDDQPDWLHGNWQKQMLFQATAGGKKIFEKVDVVSEKMEVYDIEEEVWRKTDGEYVFFGTGDRANPLRTDRVNHFYCLKNDWQTRGLTEDSRIGQFITLDDDPGSDPDGDDADVVIVDVSDNLIQDGTAEERNMAAQALNARHNRGWYLTLEDSGEKCLSSPVVFDGIVYFTTYTPPEQSSDANPDPCFQGGGDTGTSRLYALEYKTGAAVYENYNNDNDLDKRDRARILTEQPLSIPPSPKIFITANGPRLFVGAHQETPRFDLGGLGLIYWKQAE